MAGRSIEKHKSKMVQGKMKLIWKAACQIKDEAGQIEMDSDEVGKEDLEVLKQLADQIEVMSLRIGQNKGEAVMHGPSYSTRSNSGHQ